MDQHSCFSLAKNSRQWLIKVLVHNLDVLVHNLSKNIIIPRALAS